VDNVYGVAEAAGPGKVRIYQTGEAASRLGEAPTAVAPANTKKDLEMKLTIITFGGRMWAENKTHTAIFNDSIEVVDLATLEKDLDPDLDHLPSDAIYLTCADQLKVYNRPEDGKSNQQLEALGRVRCRTDKYDALCEKLTYHQGKDQFIFDGGDGGLARLKRVLAPGTQPQESKAKRFIYLRKANQVFSDEVKGVSGSN
jgi:hypothetical protein